MAVHSQGIIFSKDEFEPNPPDFIYQGGANVPAHSTCLRLTKTDSSGAPALHSVGRVLYSSPMTMWEGKRESSFETTIRFVIWPSKDGAADGIAFFIAPANAPTDSKGSIFSVEFDTYINENDPPFRHIGIDIGSRVSESCAKFDSATGKVVVAVIKYDPSTHTITVSASSGTQNASLTYVYNLSTFLPQQVQVGISSTGDASSNQGVADILSWHFTLNHPQS